MIFRKQRGYIFLVRLPVVPFALRCEIRELSRSGEAMMSWDDVVGRDGDLAPALARSVFLV
jgi:hypothetical protein